MHNMPKKRSKRHRESAHPVKKKQKPTPDVIHCYSTRHVISECHHPWHLKEECQNCRHIEMGIVCDLSPSGKIDWVQCDKCHTWQHGCCVDMNSIKQHKSIQYLCMACATPSTASVD